MGTGGRGPGCPPMHVVKISDFLSFPPKKPGLEKRPYCRDPLRDGCREQERVPALPVRHLPPRVRPRRPSQGQGGTGRHLQLRGGKEVQGRTGGRLQPEDDLLGDGFRVRVRGNGLKKFKFERATQ